MHLSWFLFDLFRSWEEKFSEVGMFYTYSVFIFFFFFSYFISYFVHDWYLYYDCVHFIYHTMSFQSIFLKVIAKKERKNKHIDDLSHDLDVKELQTDFQG